MMVEGYPGEIKEKIQRQALQRKREMQAAVTEEKQQKQGYDPTATPSRIAKLGQPVSEARLGGALASLAYEENRLEELNRKIEQEKTTSKFPATLGAMGKWLKSDTELEQLQTKQRIQKLQNRIPQLEYETWADQGLTRPEEYTAENVGGYLNRAVTLANVPYKWTKEQAKEAKEILYTQMGSAGILGIENNVWAFQPYQDAVRNKDAELAKQWETTYNRLYSRLYPRETAVVGAIQKSMGIRSFNEVLGTVLDASDEAWERYEEQVKNEDIAMAKHPVLSGITQMAGGMALYGAVDSVNGKIFSSLGSGGVLMPYVKTGANLGGVTAIREAGDVATGRLSWQEHARNILAMERMGVISSALADKLAELYDFYSSGGFEGGAASSAGQGGTALVPVQPSSGAALAGSDGAEIAAVLAQSSEQSWANKQNGENTKAIEETVTEENEDEIDFDFDEIYEELYPDSIDSYSKIRYNKDGTIVVTDDFRTVNHASTGQKYRPNAVVDTISHGKQHDRTIYGEDAYMMTQIHGGDHDNAKKHDYAEDAGVHAHDYIWIEGKKHPIRTERPLTDKERIEHMDLINESRRKK